MLVIFLLPLAWWVLLMLSGVVMVSLYIGLRRYVFMTGARTVSKLIWDAHGTLKLFNGAGKELDAELCRDTFVCHWLIILNLRTRQLGYCYMVILPDALPQETMRQLRVRVRLRQASDRRGVSLD